MNLVLVCGSGTTGCHGRIEGNRAWAESLGYLVRRGVAGPGEVPVWVAGVGWRRLTADGGVEPCPPPS
ncbi:hypothetical protein ACFQHO_53270 [Actinomadura yumaensis]|uniref:hypothetical protein n=1 Tax=Actinomadura yumaensis TaxID=111807 RepID=UPI00360E8DEF